MIGKTPKEDVLLKIDCFRRTLEQCDFEAGIFADFANIISALDHHAITLKMEDEQCPT